MTNTELTSIRKSLKLSKTDFAQAIGIAPVMEGKYEKGTREIPEAVEQAVHALLTTAEEESASVAEEETASVVEEAAVEEAAVEEKTAPVAEELASEEVVVEDAATSAAEASAEEDDQEPAGYRSAAITVFLPPLLMTKCLFDIGFLLRAGRKRGPFGLWW